MNSTAMEPIPKTGAGLRDALFDEINMLRAGKVSTEHARALANLVRQVLDAARLDLQYRKAIEGGDTLALGSAGDKKRIMNPRR